MRRFFPLLVALVTSLSLLVPALAQTGPTAFDGTRDFKGIPGVPQGFHPPGWDVTVLGRDDGSIVPLLADHGPNCEGPPTTYAPDQLSSHMHLISTTAQAVYQCADHVMTAIWSGYGAIYLTPPAMMDFSKGTSTLDWNMSTRRTGSRDWIDVVIMPWADNDQLNFIDVNVPNNAVHVVLAGGGNVLLADVLRGARANPNWSGPCDSDPQPTACHLKGDGFHTWGDVLATRGLTVSPARRDHFQVQLSRTHIKVGMPDYGFSWIDADINPPLEWDAGIVQLNQRTYNVEKSCTEGDDPNPPYFGLVHTAAADNQQTGCPPNTWHWSDVKVSPSTAFTVIPAAGPARVDDRKTAAVHFVGPAPDNSWFHGAGGPLETQISYDGGKTFHNLATVGPLAKPEQGNSYWEPMPAGVQDIVLRGSGSVQDMSIWSLSDAPVGLPPEPTTVPGATPTEPPTREPVPTSPPTAVATAVTVSATSTALPATSTPVATPTPPSGVCAVTVTLKDGTLAVEQGACP